jgi:hypothetical protein
LDNESKKNKSTIKGSSLKFKKPTPEKQEKFDIFLGVEEKESKDEDEK